MRLIHDVKGVSKLILIILLIIDFVLGALLMYIWNMGFYAPQEFRLPSQSNVTMERVEFDAQSANFFDVDILNPSYSRSLVQIDQVSVLTIDGVLHDTKSTVPSLPYRLAPGNAQSFRVSWDWLNYMGQNVKVIAFISDGSGATGQGRVPFMNLTVASVNFDPLVSAANFTVTVQSKGSDSFMNITKITLNQELVGTSPSLPYTLDRDASATFTVVRVWSDVQGKNATISVETSQGFTAQYTLVVLEIVKISSVVFNATDTSRFNLTVQNVATSQISLNISRIRVVVNGESVIITDVVPPLPYLLQPNSEVLLVCSWNWSDYKGKDAKAMITVYTEQDFFVSTQVSIP